MNKQIATLIILIHLTLSGISQTSSDSALISIPSYQLKRAINIIEKGKVVEQELSLNKEKVAILSDALTNKDLIISEYSSKDSISQKAIAGYKQAVTNLESSLANAQKINTIQKIQTRRQKLKKWYSLLIGVGIGYLIAK